MECVVRFVAYMHQTNGNVVGTVEDCTADMDGHLVIQMKNEKNLNIIGSASPPGGVC